MILGIDSCYNDPNSGPDTNYHDAASSAGHYFNYNLHLHPAPRDRDHRQRPAPSHIHLHPNSPSHRRDQHQHRATRNHNLYNYVAAPNRHQHDQPSWASYHYRKSSQNKERMHTNFTFFQDHAVASQHKRHSHHAAGDNFDHRLPAASVYNSLHLDTPRSHLYSDHPAAREYRNESERVHFDSAWTNSDQYIVRPDIANYNSGPCVDCNINHINHAILHLDSSHRYNDNDCSDLAAIFNARAISELFSASAVA
jgi:hypothetical protein